MINKFILGSFVLLIFVSCEVRPKPIDYGSEACHFCSMTIVDRQHAAQLVTRKGKVYSFDAIECMINYTKELEDIQLFLCNYYTSPEELIDATKATFLISESIPSPMGANLTAFETKELAEQFQLENNGELYSWDSLLVHFKE
jgi:copper chaperone NosL